VADINFKNYTELAAWLNATPQLWAQAIAMRTALRMLPLLWHAFQHRNVSVRIAINLIHSAFRADFISWAALRYSDEELYQAAVDATDEGASFAFADSTENANRGARAAAVAQMAARMAFAAATAVNHSDDARAYVNQVSEAVRVGSIDMGAIGLWESIIADVQLLDTSKNTETYVEEAFAIHPLWRGSIPEWAAAAWAGLRMELLHHDANWRHWCNWYEQRLRGTEKGYLPQVATSATLDIRIATQPDAWWKRGSEAVNRDIAEWVEAARTSEPREPSVSSFIIRFLSGREVPSAISEIREAFADASYDVIDKTMRGQLSRLASEGKIRRVSTGVYEVVKKSSTDFFISYSNKDEVLAKRIGAIVEGEGFTSFAQYKDMPVGSNFINEMKRGLQDSSRLIAVLSPDYEASKHCQSEWNAAYNEDPDGSRRKLIGFLTKETELNQLAKQFVYKDLTGLNDNAFRSAVIETFRAAMAGAPPPAARSKTPFDYGWTKTGKIAVLGGGMDHVSVPANRSPADAKKRLEAARILARELSDDYRDGRKNSYVRPEFIRHLDRYADRLPSDTDGNIYLSDCEARSLRTLFENELKYGIDDAFAARLRTLLEQHQGVRPYYPELGIFYDDVRTGQLSEPFPLDAVAKTEGVVAAHTPSVFMPDVSGSLDQVEQARPDAPAAQATGRTETAPPLSSMTLPPDPIADIDPERAAQQAKAGALNRLWQVLLRAEKGAKGIERVEKAVSDYGKVIGPIIDWLSKLGG
jgi:TIR domain